MLRTVQGLHPPARSVFMSDLPTPDELAQQIAANATQPASASVDGNSVAQHSLSDQIAAAKFVATQQAQKSPTQGLRFTRLRPPGGC